MKKNLDKNLELEKADVDHSAESLVVHNIDLFLRLILTLTNIKCILSLQKLTKQVHFPLMKHSFREPHYNQRSL